jgi:hypothetical protein
MLELKWVAGGVVVGMLISCILIPPTRKQVVVPQPHDPGSYHTDTGCVHLNTTEVPCVDEPESLNLLASLSKK